VQRRFLLAAAAALPFAGCEGIKRKDQSMRLNDALRGYTEAVRWSNFDTATLFTVPREGMPRRVDPATLAGLKVTGFTVRINYVNEAADEADVNIDFSYYHEDQGTIRTVEQHATWYWSDPRGGWVLDDSLPEFRR
jgi:hypothetical protein